LVKASRSGGQVAKAKQILFSKVQHWFQILHILFDAKQVAYEEC